MAGSLLAGSPDHARSIVTTQNASADYRPAKLAYATYLPGPAVRYSAVDSSGAMYVSGRAYPECASKNSETVSKLATDGSALLWTRCFDGALGGIAVDRAGMLYVANNVNGSAILSKFNGHATRVIYSTRIAKASATAIAADANGNLFVTGSALPGFAVTTGAYSDRYDSGRSGFLTKIGPDGAAAVATMTGSAPAVGIAVDSHGQPWIAGTGWADALPPHYQGFQYGYAAHFDSALAHVIGSGGFRGSWAGPFPLNASATGISIDAQDAVYVVGSTCRLQTTPGGLPVISPFGQYSPSPAISKYNASGELVYGRYLLSYYTVYAAAGTADGGAYVATTTPADTPAGARTCGGGRYFQISRLSPDGSTLTPVRVLPVTPLAYFADQRGGLYMTGFTDQTAFLPTSGAYRTQYPGPGAAGFAAKLDLTEEAGVEIACVANAATGWAGRNSLYATGAVAPGEVISIFGGPFQSGSAPRVEFDDIAAPLLYSDTGQINAVAPFDTGATGAFTKVRIEEGDRVIWSYELPVSKAVPGIFSIANENGAPNSSSAPASPGSLISVFLTGAGVFDRSLTDGSTGPLTPPLPAPQLRAAAVIQNGSGLHEVQVVSAVQAPGLVAGVVRMDVRLPDDFAAGTGTLVVYFGGFPSPGQLIYISK